MSNSLNLQLPYVEAAQAQKHVTVNEALRRLDAVVQLAVKDRIRTSPPASPVEGDRHIVAGGPTGAWAGRAQHVAAYVDGAWVFFAPKAGWFTFVTDESAIVYYTGSAWETLTPVGGLEAVGKLGINGTASDINRLVVRSDGALFTADTGKATPTGDIKVYTSKTATGDVASHIFQTNFSGRAELGLIESDDFSLKVSGNGTTFSEAFKIGAATARMDLARMPSLKGVDVFSASFASRAAVAASIVPTEIVQFETRGYASENDGGGAVYRRVASQPTHELRVQDASGAWFEIVPESGWIRAKQAGAVGDGAADNTAALNRAIAAGFNVVIDAGNYRVSGPITVATRFQQIRGAGRQVTNILVRPDFPLSAAGVIVFAEQQIDLADLTIDFLQQGVVSRATLIQYPPAINMVGRERCRLARLRFRAAYDGILATGNTGQSIFYDIECGSFNIGVHLGGAVGAVQMHNVRVWPYEFTSPALAPLYDIFSDSNTIAFKIGRVDDLKMVSCTGFRARTIFEPTEGVGPFGSIVGCALDGPYSRIEMSGGELQMSSLYATSDAVDDYFIRLTGGQLSISSFDLDCETYTAPAVLVSGGTLTMSSGTVSVGPHASTTVFRVDNGQLHLSNTRFFASSGTVRTAPIIEQAVNGVLSLVGNSINPLLTSGSVFARINSDTPNTVVGNSCPSHTLAVPANATNGVYGPNLFGSGSGNVLIGANAGLVVGTGSSNTGIGTGTFGSGTANVSNCTAIGNGAVVTGSNQVQLGNTATTTYVFGTVATRSDARDKADVRDTVLGLDFVRALRPVDYRWDYREDYGPPAGLAEGEQWTPPEPGSLKRTRFHHGFLAQDVEAVIVDTGIDFGGLQDHARAGGADVKTLGYDELIAPLVRAVQQLADRLDALDS